MFSTSKVGGIRGSRTLLSGWHPPSYTHHPAVQPGSSFIVNKRLTKVKPRSSANLRGGLPLFPENPRRVLLGNRASGIRASRKLANLCWHILIQSPISLTACPLGARSLEFGLAAPRSPSCHAHTLPP